MENINPLTHQTLEFEAIRALSRGEIESARKIFCEIKIHSSGDPRTLAMVYLGLGLCEKLSGNTITACQYFEDSIQEKPTLAGIENAIQCAVELGRKDLMRQWAMIGLDLDTLPESTALRFRMLSSHA